MSTDKYNKDYIVILVCANVPNQKFWNGKIKDWTSNLEEATIYPTFGDGLEAEWFDVPEEKATHRLTLSNITLYKLFSSGKWDGFSSIPDDVEP